VKHTTLFLTSEQVFILQQAGIRISEKRYHSDFIEVKADIHRKDAARIIQSQMSGAKSNRKEIRFDEAGYPC